ncbi:E3 ubiquitin-protein ligase TRIM21-like [Genypterus blacodes]|uniref:E3 ubiquitin-protein ligase TRIM21-like n=1 Tax=Genypterus blacodes TaxID=154954 RepID=UPI003F75C3AA
MSSSGGLKPLRKLKGLKFRWSRQASNSEIPTEPSMTAPHPDTQQPPDPMDSQESGMCMTHNEPLDLYCKTDRVYACSLCLASAHRSHNVVPLKKECDAKKIELRKSKAKIQQMIHERRLKIPEMKHSAERGKDAGNKEIASSIQVFTALNKSVEHGLGELIEKIKEKQKTSEELAKSSVTELEQEISELTTTSAELQQILGSEDHLQLHKSFQSLNITLPTKNWTEVNIDSSYDGMVKSAVAELEQTFIKDIERGRAEAEAKWAQKYAVDVTLDPDTANPWLILSEDWKEVTVCVGDECQETADSPERFDPSLSVMGSQPFSSGRFYYEVLVEGKTEWDLGVAKESVQRTGVIRLEPGNGFWTLCLRNAEYFAHAGPAVRLNVEGQCGRVGVYVDYDEGSVSFFRVDTTAVLYSFTGLSFTDRLLPYFSPGLPDDGNNLAPMVIAPVQHTD